MGAEQDMEYVKSPWGILKIIATSLNLLFLIVELCYNFSWSGGLMSLVFIWGLADLIVRGLSKWPYDDDKLAKIDITASTIAVAICFLCCSTHAAGYTITGAGSLVGTRADTLKILDDQNVTNSKFIINMKAVGDLLEIDESTKANSTAILTNFSTAISGEKTEHNLTKTSRTSALTADVTITEKSTHKNGTTKIQTILTKKTEEPKTLNPPVSTDKSLLATLVNHLLEDAAEIIPSKRIQRDNRSNEQNEKTENDNTDFDYSLDDKTEIKNADAFYPADFSRASDGAWVSHLCFFSAIGAGICWGLIIILRQWL